uniref:HTH CENPB-type domain-containing protein n=1 Tax=Rhinopithecus bieti TaxID=61621 RepID=A0A2K6M851_RHIBE
MPTDKTVIPSAKRERKAITLGLKLEVLRRFEVLLSLQWRPSEIVKKKIKASSQIATPLRASRLTRHRSAVMESVERLLSLWLEDQRQRNAPLNAAIVQKAKFDDLQREHGESSQAERFPMSKGWLVRFKERHCLPHFKLNSAAPDNKNMYTEMLKSVIIEEGESAPGRL